MTDKIRQVMNPKFATDAVRGSALLLLVVSLVQVVIGLYSNNAAVLIGSGTALAHTLLLLALSKVERELIPIYIRMISMVTCSALILIVSLRMIETNYGFAKGDSLLVDFSYGTAYTSVAIAASSGVVALAVDFVAVTQSGGRLPDETPAIALAYADAAEFSVKGNDNNEHTTLPLSVRN